MNRNSNQTVILVISMLFLLHLPLLLNAGTYKEITDFGDNPSTIKMFLYTPDKIAAKPAVLVACHWCHGTADAIYNGSRYCSVADKNGYYVIFPNANSSDGCWDVASVNALTHNGGGDPLGIVSMVRYVIKNLNADSTRVYAVGVSSGAMMVNVLLGAYPDVFAAGSAFAGVPFGCFAGPNSWNSECAAGTIAKTAKEWGDLVRAAYPGYTGKRPKIQMWHGSNDEVLNYRDLGEAVKQWTNVLGADTTPSSTETNVFQTGWTRQRYTNNKKEIVVETITEQGVSHNLQVLQEEAIAFLGLDQSTGIQASSVNKKGSLPHATIIVSPNKSGGATFTIRSLQGTASLALYTVNGRMVYNLPGKYSSKGIYTFTTKGNTLTPTPQTSNVYIAKVVVNGADAGTLKFTL